MVLFLEPQNVDRVMESLESNNSSSHRDPLSLVFITLFIESPLLVTLLMESPLLVTLIMENPLLVTLIMENPLLVTLSEPISLSCLDLISLYSG